MGDDLGLTRGDDSPWAGDVPSAAPASFQWAPPRGEQADDPSEPSIERAIEGYANIDAQPRLRTTDTDADTSASEPSASRTKTFVALAIVGVAALGATSLLAGRNDARSTESPAESPIDSAGTPSTDTGAPSTTIGRLEPVRTDPPATTDGGPGEPVFGTDPDAETGVWTTGTFAPPDALRDADEPTVVVAISRDGVLRELDLATGSFEQIRIGSTTGPDQVLIGRSSTLVGGGRGPGAVGTAVMYRAGEPPITLGAEFELAIFDVRPNSDGFGGFLFGVGPADYRDLEIAPDGTVEQTPRNLDDGRRPWLRRYAPNGNELFEDGGSVFEVQPDGVVTLLTAGELVSTSSHHMLVRECDDTHTCTWLVIDGATGARQPVRVGPEFDSVLAAGAAQISPDGTRLWFSRFDQESGQYIMDLETGEAIGIAGDVDFVDTGSAPAASDVWTADSAGIIRSTSDAFEFVDAVTGERTEFGSELNGAVAFGVRLDLAGVARPRAIEPTDTGIRIAGFGNGGVHRIDIDSGEMISVETGTIGSGAPVYVMSDSNGISVVAYDNVDGFRVEGDVVTPITGGPFGGPMIAGPQPDTIWVPGDRSDGGVPGTYELFDSLGRSLGASLRVPSDADGVTTADGAGGLVTGSTLGGAYAVDQTGVSRITTGELLALGPVTAIAHECDEQLDCGVVVIDRVGGGRVALDDPVLASVVDQPPTTPMLAGHAVAPSGDVALLFDRIVNEFVFADLASGETVAAPGPDAVSTIVWSSDGRAAVYLSEGRLHLYERADASVRPLTQLPRLRAFAQLSE